MNFMKLVPRGIFKLLGYKAVIGNIAVSNYKVSVRYANSEGAVMSFISDAVLPKPLKVKYYYSGFPDTSYYYIDCSKVKSLDNNLRFYALDVMVRKFYNISTVGAIGRCYEPNRIFERLFLSGNFIVNDADIGGFEDFIIDFLKVSYEGIIEGIIRERDNVYNTKKSNKLYLENARSKLLT